MARQIDEHLTYVRDTRRVAAYDRAISRQCTPDDIVLDLGAGTGILGMLAARAGASRVYAVDSGPILGLASGVAQDNGYANRIIAVQGRSFDITLQERATLVVCDQLGPLGYDTGYLEAMDDALTRLAVADARMIPAAVTTTMVPVTHRLHDRRIAAWTPLSRGLDFQRFRTLAANDIHPVHGDFGTRLAPPAHVWTFAPSRTAGAPRRLDGTASWTITREGRCDGLLGWFTADLGAGILLTNDPLSPEAMDRVCAYLPLDPPCDVIPGDKLDMHLHAVPSGGVTGWRGSLQRAGQRVCQWSHNTLGNRLPLVFINR